MRIHILGAGVVGRATGRGFERFGHEVLYSDKGDDHAAVSADLHFICTPEGVAAEVVRGMALADGHIVIRSSVPPGTCDALTHALHRAIYHNPEFLREATAEADFLEAPVAILGRPQNHLLPDSLFNLYEEMGKRCIVCFTRESELLKLLNNAHLASLISWWNEVAQLCRAVGVSSHHLACLMVQNDARISPYGALRHGAPYGGRCLPKDMGQLRGLAATLGVPTPLLNAVEKINVRLMLKQE